MFSLSQIRAQARQTVNQTQGIFLLALIPVIATVVYNIFRMMNQNSEQLLYLAHNESAVFSVVLSSVAFPFIFSLLIGFLNLSISYTMWQVITGKKEGTGAQDSLAIFQHSQFGKIITTVLVKQAFLFLWSLLMGIGTVLFIASIFIPAIYMLTMGIIDPNQIPEDVLAVIGLAFIVGLLFLIGGYALYIPQYLAYSQVEFILFEQLEAGTYTGPLAIIKESRRIMRGYKGSRFVLDLTFIGWFILVGITFGILNIYVLPYYYSSQVYFYQAVLKETALKEAYLYKQFPQA